MERNESNPFIPTALLILMTLVIGFMPIPSDPDLWFHLADGDYILSHRCIPQTDPFSFTKADGLWVPQSWMFDVGIALSWEHLGPRATEGIMAIVFALTMVISFRVLTARGMDPLQAAALCMGLAIAAGNTRGIRPQVFTLLLCNLVIFLLVQHRYRPRRRLLVYLPLIFLLWAQFHSACVLGLIVVAVWLGGRAFEALVTRSAGFRWRELGMGLAALALSVPAVLVTPHRISHFRYIALTMNLNELKRTAEWKIPHALTFEVPDIYMYVLVAGIVVLLARRARRVGWAEISLCVALVMLGLTGVRHIPLACIGSVPLIGDVLARHDGVVASSDRVSVKPVVALGVVAAAVLLGLWRYPIDIQSRYAREEPVNGARRLADFERPLRVFTTYNTGSYVLWAAPEHLRVFVDSRADVYGDKLLGDAYRAMNGQGWESLFEHWRVDGAVVERWNPLAGILAQNNDWRLLAEDPSTLTFVRSTLRPTLSAKARR